MRLDGVLRGITALIVQTCDPEKIVLFGSYAKGRENADSDLDILVIGDFRESRFLRGRELRELFHRYPIRIDLHLVTPWEVAEQLAEHPVSFLNSVFASGVELYSRESEKYFTNGI